MLLPIFIPLIALGMWSGASVSYGSDNEVMRDLDQEVVTLVGQPNKWGYSLSVFGLPYLRPEGLTYGLSMIVNVTDIKLTSISEVEQLHAEIYGKNLNALNSMRKLRPFLANFPLTQDTFYVSVGFDDQSGNSLRPPYFSAILMGSEGLTYNQHAEGKKPYPRNTILIKPTRDSQVLQKFYHPSVPRTTCQDKPVVPIITKKKAYKCLDQQAMFTFAQNFSATNHVNFLTVGPVGTKGNYTLPLQIGFWGHQCFDVQNARHLIVQCATEFLRLTETNTDILNYINRNSKDDIQTIPKMKDIVLRFSFWDENIDRQPEPYIAEIRLENEKILYFTADENQFLKLVQEESVDEAQAVTKTIPNE